MNTKITTHSAMPLHLPGASPLSYYCGNMVWQNIIESGKKIFEQNAHNRESAQPVTILDNAQSGYNDLHQVAFVDAKDQRIIVENSSFENLNARDNNGNTPLMWATSQGNEQLVELLVDQGAAVNMQNFVGETALYMAAARGFDRICSFLISSGGNTQFANVDGISPLHVAAASGNLTVLTTLVGYGAFVNAVDEEGDTPLHYAVREGRKDIVEYLVKQCGADFGLRNEDSESPLDLAQEMDEVEIVALLSGCDATRFGVADLPEHHLYFGEENHQFHQKKEQEAVDITWQQRAAY